MQDLISQNITQFSERYLNMRNNEVLSRLQNLINYVPLQKELVIKTGINQNTLSAKATRNSNWKDAEIQKLNKAYNVDIYKEISYDRESFDDKFINIPILGDVKASMGYGITIYDENQTGSYPFSLKLAKDLGINLENSDIVFGAGNSMEPTIYGGDALLVDKSRREINDGKIYCIRQDGQLKVKRLQKLSKTKLKIISDNKDYEPTTLDFTKDIDVDFEVIGEIRWCGRVFL